MIHAGITFPSNNNLSPVSRSDLQGYCFDVLHCLDVLFKSAAEASAVESFSGGPWAGDIPEWTGSNEQCELVEKTALWVAMEQVFNYAELGQTLKMGESEIDAILASMAQWIGATVAFREFNWGTGDCLGEKIIYKFIARLKLDYGWDLEERFVPISSNWFPQTHPTHLTILEVALLAGMDSIRSVRNATYDKESPLTTIKEGRSVLVPVVEARRWLQGRKGFVATEGADYGVAE